MTVGWSRLAAGQLGVQVPVPVATFQERSQFVQVVDGRQHRAVADSVHAT